MLCLELLCILSVCPVFEFALLMLIFVWGLAVGCLVGWVVGCLVASLGVVFGGLCFLRCCLVGWVFLG